MLCLTCTEPTGSIVCEPCASQLRLPPDMVLGNGLLVVGGFVHEGPARRLVHSLKYRGVVAAAAPLAAAMVRRLPDSASMLVPVPRAWWRAMRYGVDPTAVLSAVVGRRSGLPVVQALAAPLLWRRHAGKMCVDRARVLFRQRSVHDAGAVTVEHRRRVDGPAHDGRGVDEKRDIRPGGRRPGPGPLDPGAAGGNRHRQACEGARGWGAPPPTGAGRACGCASPWPRRGRPSTGPRPCPWPWCRRTTT